MRSQLISLEPNESLSETFHMSAFDDPGFADSYPVPFLMRDTHRDSWFRIHSLPESKRYPDSEKDWQILLDRHRQLSDAVLGKGSHCRVHYSLFVDRGFPEELEPSLDWGDVVETPLDEETRVFTRSAETRWDFDTFQPWIRLRSEDQLAWISFHSLSTDRLYCPYDGGADIFSADKAGLSAIRKQFSDWKSSHPEGL